MSLRVRILVVASPVLLSCLLSGCEDKVVRGTAAPGASGSAPRPMASALPQAAPASSDKPLRVEIQEADFTEGDRSRDPFRSFAALFTEESHARVKTQREVVLDQYGLDELKLVGIVTRIQPERALMIDPTGKGHVIRRGQFVGRAEVVQGATPGADYEINWRVERIRDNDVVLVRDDPSHPDVPAATRIIPLRTEPQAPQ